MSIFHVKYPRMKHEENSIRGIREAKAKGFTEIDVDMQPDGQGNIYGCHWGQPMVKDGFRDTAKRKRMPKTTPITHMTPAEVGRLVAGYVKRYRVHRIERLIAECAAVRIGMRAEPKHPMFTKVGPWQHLHQVAKDKGCALQMYALREHAGDPHFGEKCVAAAKTAGVPGKVIH